jgi:transposase-like protein
MSKLISPSEMRKMFQKSSVGKRWYHEEKSQLIKELEEGLTIEEIAFKHGRTVNGIYFKVREHAYQLYLKNIPIEEIIQKLKLSKQEIEDTINYEESKQQEKKKLEEIKKDIQEIKNSMKELIEMIKAIYEFED